MGIRSDFESMFDISGRSVAYDEDLNRYYCTELDFYPAIEHARDIQAKWEGWQMCYEKATERCYLLESKLKEIAGYTEDNCMESPVGINKEIAQNIISIARSPFPEYGWC